MTSAAPTAEPFDIAIIGAGFCGTLTAAHLLGAGRPLRVALIDRTGRFGPGVAYQPPSPEHLLNVPAERMGAFPHDPGHFLTWLQARRDTFKPMGVRAEAGEFLPRAVYGRYLSRLLDEAETNGRAAGVSFARVEGEATDVEPLPGGGHAIHLDHGDHSDATPPPLRARQVVLALGNFPPGDPRARDRRFHDDERYLRSPWSEQTIELLSRPGDVLLLGAGLTALDLIVALRERKRMGVIHVLSRRGLFPLAHRAVPSRAPFLANGELPRTVLGALHRLREEVDHAAAEGADWRAVVDSLRGVTPAIWRGWSHAERRRFLRHARPYWEAHRHRAPAATLAVCDALKIEGRLCAHRGRLQCVARRGELLETTYHSALTGETTTVPATYVANCTGPESSYAQLRDRLVLALFDRGLVRPDPLFLGLDADDAGALRDVEGATTPGLWTLGSLRKGALFETTAVPELRIQAAALATRLLAPHAV